MLRKRNLLQPDYKFYATLLDAFQYYTDSEDEGALQEFIDKVNRVPFTSEAADKGTAFNELVDKVKQGVRHGYTTHLKAKGEDVIIYPYTNKLGIKTEFEFTVSLVSYFANYYENAIPQFRIKAILPTSKGNVELYGDIDELSKGSADDIKTTGNYEFPKFLWNWQHVVYPYCLIQNGITEDAAGIFTYHITDFKNIYKEVYVYNSERDLPRLVNICERFIDFLEEKRHLITDRKVFAMDTLVTL